MIEVHREQEEAVAAGDRALRDDLLGQRIDLTHQMDMRIGGCLIGGQGA